MPITLPETLPAYDVLRNEGVMVMSPERAARQDIRPLKIEATTSLHEGRSATAGGRCSVIE